uniref:Uncharacterized protein n=1 Tax=Knipowitschia caucasica TaxID=637954 RepID=A0AAV2MGG8_KNICA
MTTASATGAIRNASATPPQRLRNASATPPLAEGAAPAVYPHTPRADAATRADHAGLTIHAGWSEDYSGIQGANDHRCFGISSP